MIFLISPNLMFFWLIIHQFLCGFSYIFNGNISSESQNNLLAHELKDLEKNDLRFASDADAWSHSALFSVTTLPYSQCGSNYILGGFKVLASKGTLTPGGHYFSRSYVNLPVHTRIHFSFQLWMIDSWDSNDDVEIIFDSKMFIGWNMNTYNLAGVSSICGSGWKDFAPITVSGTFAHTSSSLTLTIKSFTDENTQNEALGFRDINLLFVTSSTLSTDTICGNAILPLPYQQCSCPDGQYNDGTACVPCHGSCSLCFGPSANDCYKCKQGYSFDGVTCFSCSSNCSSCTMSNPNQCVSCKTGYSLFKNSTCVLTNHCIFPFSRADLSTYCESPCNAADYVYWNQTCFSICSSPLIPQILSGVLKYCRYPCNGKEYLYWNGSCESTCPPPLIPRIESGKLFCDLSCNLSEYLYLNGSCPIKCEPGTILDKPKICKECQFMKIKYVRSITGGHQYRLRLFPNSCDLDETIVQDNLLITNESRKDFPSYSFKVTKLRRNVYSVNLILSHSLLESRNINVKLAYLNGSIYVPRKFVGGPVLQNIAEYSKTAQITLLGIMGASFGGTLALGAISVLWSMISFQQFVGYFIYINVEYPFQVSLFLSLFQSISWDILPNPLASLTSMWSRDILNPDNDDDLIEQYLPPQKFVDYEISSFFVENAGTIIVVNILLFILLFLIVFLLKLGYFTHNKILKLIESNLRWNIILRTFLENGIPLALGTFLQLRYFTFENVYLAICAISTILAGINLIFMILFIIAIFNNTSDSSLDSPIVKKIIGTLYEGMILADTSGKYYYLIILFRGILLMTLLAFCEYMSLVQSSMMIFYNAWLVNFLFKHAKFENTTLNIINRIKEILILIGEICILFIQFHVKYEEYYDVFGWLMVSCLALALIIELGYMLIIQIIGIKKIFRRIVRLCKDVRRLLYKSDKI